MVFGLITAVVVLLVMVLLFQRRNWKVLMSATGEQTEDVEAIYAFFRAHKVKCRFVSDNGPAAPAGFISPVNEMHSDTVVKLKVHQKDMELAKELMEAYQEEAFH